jgi:hypothetical protein
VSRTRLFALLMVCFAIPLTIAACGGDDDDDGGGSGEEDAIAEAIETSATSNDPADCAVYQTENFLEQLELTGPDESALESCEENAPDPSGDPDSVEVSEISVDGETATADATFMGGAFDGSTLSLALVKTGDQWMLDELTEFQEFNFDAFLASLNEELGADPEIPPEGVTCVSDAITAAGAEEIERILVEGDDEAFFELLGEC